MTFASDRWEAWLIHSPVPWTRRPMAHRLDERRRKRQVARMHTPAVWLISKGPRPKRGKKRRRA